MHTKHTGLALPSADILAVAVSTHPCRLLMLRGTYRILPPLPTYSTLPTLRSAHDANCRALQAPM